MIDGVNMVFQMVPDTEAPSEFNVYFPNHRALYIAECATNTMHNIITLRGAAVRNAKRWSKRLDETLALYGHDSDVLFSGHHWPTWDRENIVKFISDHRDLYAYMHDQTVRLMNTGLNGVEIADQLRLPPALQKEWYIREYYGALSQNVKGIYQRYMTWFDGNAANLWRHTPVEEGKRYIACMGGVEAVMQKAQEYAKTDDLRFAATLLDHVIKAEPENTRGHVQLAEVYESIAFSTENAVWRNYYLTAAQGLRSLSQQRTQPEKTQPKAIALNPHSSVEDWLDALSVQLDGPRACALTHAQVILIDIPEQQTTWILQLRNGTLTYRSQATAGLTIHLHDSPFDLRINLSKSEIFDLISSGQLAAAKDRYEGSIDTLKVLLDLCSIG